MIAMCTASSLSLLIFAFKSEYEYLVRTDKLSRPLYTDIHTQTWEQCLSVLLTDAMLLFTYEF